ncbi:MAG: biotin--[acetyl-CoA-carboxylase] ligase [Beijerinckiaceae bacterium]|nr:biotin--[acetyl-CoA-carboxylase] ligase [Beijerinckiaceae bacterium]
MTEAGPYRAVFHDSLGSTNDEAMALARSGERGPLFVVAESQTGGRGRQGRVWFSPRGNLYASFLLSDPAPLQALPQLGFVAGVALARALRALSGGGERLRLKWPNDILFEGAKLAGILLESTTLPDGRVACVIGFGVNCQSSPDGLAYPTSHMTQAAGRSIAPGDVLAALGSSLQTQLDLWDRGAGFSTIRQAWLAIAAGVDDIITVTSFSRVVTGRFAGLDETGRLLVETEGGRVVIDAGDVFLHGATRDMMT